MPTCTTNTALNPVAAASPEGDHSSGAATSAAMALMPTCITSLHVSPFWPMAFLAGHDNGTVVLHTSECASASLIWPEAAAGRVQAVRWSPTRPCVFFVLDALCTVHSFDLTRSRWDSGAAAGCISH